MSKKAKVNVELYDLLITKRKNDRFGRVVFTGSLKIEDLIALAVMRRSDINAATMMASYDILNDIALEEVCSGKQVEFGLSHYRLGVNGVFIGDYAKWNSDEDSLSLQSVATAKARGALKEVAVEVHGMAASGLYVNTLTDVTSGEVNTRLTPGGGVNLTGVKIKIAGDKPEVGIHLTEINTAAVVNIPATSILINEPSKVTFIVPSGLPAGDYRLSLTTQFASNTLLKEPRTYVFDNVLTCG